VYESILNPVNPLNPMDFKSRLERAREEMKRRDIDLMYLTRGANLWYLAGVKRKGPELTDSNAYGDYICGAYIGAEDGFVLVGPRMGGAGWKAEAEGKPYIDDVTIFDEQRKPIDVQKELLTRFKTPHNTIALDDRTWAESTLTLKKNNSKLKFSLANEIIAPMRMIKDADEIKAMKEAAHLTDKVFAETIKFLHSGVTESSVEKEIDRLYAAHGAEQTSFVTSVRFRSPKKPSGTAPSNKRKLEKGDSVSFDFGCLLNGYANDFGRAAFCGTPPEEMEKIHDLVMDSQAAGIEKMVDGKINAQDLDKVSRGVIERTGYGECFTHRLGHGIGVTVHESPFLYIPDKTLLREGMTFTVEPSILLPKSWSARVEDVVLVTKKGGEPFTKYHKELSLVD
jgi:Xaa-Pro aminopeptidase